MVKKEGTGNLIQRQKKIHSLLFFTKPLLIKSFLQRRCYIIHISVYVLPSDHKVITHYVTFVSKKLFFTFSTHFSAIFLLKNNFIFFSPLNFFLEMETNKIILKMMFFGSFFPSDVPTPDDDQKKFMRNYCLTFDLFLFL